MDNISDKPSEWQPSFWKQRRNQVAFLAFFGFFNVFLLRVNLSVSIVAMSTALDLGTTNEFDWGTELRGAIMSSFFYGYFFTQIIGGVLAAKFGGVRLIGISILSTGLLTVLTPVAARCSVFLVIGVRAVEGIFEGMTYPAIYAVWSRWAPPDECTRLGSFALSGSYLGTVVGYPMCGWLAENFGWPSTFYVPGCISIAWCVIWLTCVAELPINDKFITKQELKYIIDSIGPTGDKKNGISNYPWKDIFTSMPVWAIACAHFCENWGFYTLLTQLPSYMSEVLKFNIEKGSLLSAIPYLVMTIVLQTTGFFVDWLRKKNVFTNTQIRKFFNCSAFLSQAVFMFLVGNSKNTVESIFCLTLGVGLGAFAIPGFMVNPLDIAPQYASIVLGFSNTIATIPGIISPLLTGFIVKNKTAEEWQLVFLISSGLYLFGAIFYAIFASGERQTWAVIVKAEENIGVDGGRDNKTFAMKTS